MKSPIIYLTLLALLQSTVLADFSRSQAVLHPQLPAAGPFIIEIAGTWPTDCHPGEQKPVVAAWDGQAVKIEFEIIVVHVTCNDADTPYRVLVDMSEAVRTLEPMGDTLDLQVDYQGATWEQSVPLVCPTGDDCTADNAVPQGAERRHGSLSAGVRRIGAESLGVRRQPHAGGRLLLGVSAVQRRRLSRLRAHRRDA